MTPPTTFRFIPSKDVCGVYRDTDAERFHVRKNPRIAQYDYSTPNYYFVTICTRDKRCLFGKPGQYNACGEIARQGIEEIDTHFPSVRVDKYVVMPNHVHAILELRNHDADLSVVIGQYKSYVTRKVRKILPETLVWQTSYHDHVIRDQTGYEKIWQYIEGNPQNWERDCFFMK